jgi:hypothetical protein
MSIASNDDSGCAAWARKAGPKKRRIRSTQPSSPQQNPPGHPQYPHADRAAGSPRNGNIGSRKRAGFLRAERMPQSGGRFGRSVEAEGRKTPSRRKIRIIRDPVLSISCFFPGRSVRIKPARSRNDELEKSRRQGAQSPRSEAYFAVRRNRPAPAKAGEGVKRNLSIRTFYEAVRNGQEISG